MPSKKDSRAKRRKKLFSAAPNAALLHLSQTTPQGFVDTLGALALRQHLGEGPPSGNSFDNPHLWDALARAALRLDGDDFISVALRAAFDCFRLDPVDPFSWRILVSLFAYVEFGRRPRVKAGAPKKWNEERLGELRAVLEQMRAGGLALSDKEIARRLARDPRFGAKGNNAGAGREGLRKAIRRARQDLP